MIADRSWESQLWTVKPCAAVFTPSLQFSCLVKLPVKTKVILLELRGTRPDSVSIFPRIFIVPRGMAVDVRNFWQVYFHRLESHSLSALVNKNNVGERWEWFWQGESVHHGSSHKLGILAGDLSPVAPKCANNLMGWNGTSHLTEPLLLTNVLRELARKKV